MLAYSTSLRRRKMSAVPLPWWTSVEDEHALQAQLVDREPRRDGDVVEQAEAHRAGSLGVVS